ncbi:putative iron-regulated membrane protein [Catalinimonas alkaloidigena]|uniref:PepSY-associated TM helix domain-containing protein n=1 Tax=Catalinimonas alkaloidigena TaxID=1075417 RepID=UPI002405FA6B|nr:PepSY-associated TM helix domain-containing protein [Catalinimonas alkaloidigena]MDF9798327.1 putative iron-regulated membrane protein [Catalinimonas alkaloidigena]
MSFFDVQKIALSLRKYRQWHRWVGISIALLVLISSITGILLAWKKDVAILQPPTLNSSSHTAENWLSIDEIAQLAEVALLEHTQLEEVSIDRMDVRLDKGIVKVNFVQAYWEVQVDGFNGAVLSIARRHSDWIEQVHDGSIISDFFKLLSMNALGVGLLILMASGVWLWFGPKKIRKMKKRQQA